MSTLAIVPEPRIAQIHRVTILLVDDHLVVRHGLKLVLESWGYAVEECGLACECLQAVERLELELVVLDLGLPDMDGLTLLSQLLCTHPRLPVLVLSGQEDTATALASILTGARGFTVKAACPDQLHVAVQTVASGGCYLHPRVAAPVLAELRSGRRGWHGLNPRESAVVGYLLKGLTNAAIAGQLNVSVGTVKRDLVELYRKLEVSDRGELVTEAVRRNWRRYS